MNFEDTFLCVSLDVIYLSFGNGIVEVWKRTCLLMYLKSFVLKRYLWDI